MQGQMQHAYQVWAVEPLHRCVSLLLLRGQVGRWLAVHGARGGGAGERVRRPGRVNRNYYPYYIYKILDQLLAEDDLENRRALYYIYVQSKETVEADDADWEQICIELAEIAYVPTDRTKALKYRPM